MISPSLIETSTGKIIFQETALSTERKYTVTAKSLEVTATTSFTVTAAAAVSGVFVRNLMIGYFNSYQFVKNVPLLYPLYISGVPDTCTTNIPLPNGLNFSINGLTGKPTGTDADATVEKEYRFFCKTERSTTNHVVVKSKIHSIK